MKHILILCIIVILFSGCQWQQDTPSNPIQGYIVDIVYGEYEDFVTIDSVSESDQRNDGLKTLILKSEDLIYKIKVVPKLLTFLNKNEKYKFTWKRYQIKNTKSSTEQSDVKDINCWKNIQTLSGKEVILSGDIDLKKDMLDPGCLVEVVFEAI